VIFEELLRGHPINERDLRVVLGHTPLEVVGGILLGMVVATTQWFIWK
jgi:acid phosphatase family membrane protein YuiD